MASFPLEPIEKVFVEIPNENLGGVMENLSGRKAQITNMNHVGNQVSVEALAPMPPVDVDVLDGWAAVSLRACT